MASMELGVLPWVGAVVGLGSASEKVYVGVVISTKFEDVPIL